MTSGESGFAEINGARFYYEVAGSGPALMMAHAGIADSRMWDPQFTLFAQHYRAARYDLRGFGKTEPVDGQYAHRDDLAGLLNFLNMGRVILVGCSMAGSICMDVALEHPDKVSALVMVGSAPNGLQLDVEDPPEFAQAEAAWEAGDVDRTNELEIRIWVDGTGRAPDQVDPAVRALALDMNGLALRHALRKLGARKPPLQPHAAHRLDEIRIPVLVVVGDRDGAYEQAAADYMEQHIAGARKAVLSNTAHLPNLERPNEFNRIVLDFLAQLPGSAD